MTKGSTVYYKAHGTVYSALVKRVHRDGSATVEARFAVPRDGTSYLGLEYRAYADVFHKTPEMAARA